VIIMVTGGRDYPHPSEEEDVEDILDQYDEQGNVLMVGMARGLDWFAWNYWTYTLQRPAITVPAQWDFIGKQAGIFRNMNMVDGKAIYPAADLVPDLVLAFPGGRGTAHASGYAEKHRVEIREVP
jgi:hypothetical protein